MVTLADLRARNVLPSWQEAVAVVQELIHTTIAERGSADRLPDIEHIGLDAKGCVLLLPGGSSPSHPVQHLAVVLEILLDNVSAPQPLVDLVSQNRSTSPQHATAADFANALAFFERPGRGDDIARLVDRLEQAEERTRAENELERLVARTREIEEPAPAREPRSTTTSRRRWAAALAAVSLVVLVSGAAVAWRMHLRVGAAPFTITGSATTEPKATTTEPKATPSAPEPRTASAPAAAQPASLFTRVTQAVRSGIRSLTGGGTESPAPPAPTAGPAAPPAHARARGRRSPAAGAGEPVARTGAVSAVLTDLGGYPLDQGTPGGEAGSGQSLSSAPDPGDLVDVYTAAQPGVLPPVLLRPVIAVAPDDAPPEHVGIFEIVVGPTGAVEQVHTVSVPTQYHDRMIVSHLKAWTFQPAVKDGTPVRYRLRVRLTV